MMHGLFDCCEVQIPQPLLYAIRFFVYLLLPPLHLLSRPSPRSSPLPQPPSPQTPPDIKHRLPVVKFARLRGGSLPAGGVGEEQASPRCVICLRGLETEDEVRELGSCRHAFHKACIDGWIDVHAKTCPLCRSLLLPPERKEGFAVKFFTRIWRRGKSIN